MSDYKELEYKETLLKAYNFLIRNVMSYSYIANIKFNSYEDPAMSGMITSISALVYGESHKTQEIIYPSNWWESFKERWFPKWLLKKYPVIYNIVKLEAATFYPEISMPDKKK